MAWHSASLQGCRELRLVARSVLSAAGIAATSAFALALPVLLAPATAAARPFTPQVVVSAENASNATANTVPNLKQTLYRTPAAIQAFPACPPETTCVPTATPTTGTYALGEQALKDLSIMLPKHWRVNGLANVAPCELNTHGKSEIFVEPPGCDPIGTVKADVYLFGWIRITLGNVIIFDWGYWNGTLPVEIPGYVYLVRSEQYFGPGSEAPGDEGPGYDKVQWDAWQAKGYTASELPAVMVVNLGALPDPEHPGALNPAAPMYMVSTLHRGDFRIQADIRDVTPPWITSFLSKMELSFNPNLDNTKGLFRTPPTGACSQNQTFDVTAASYADAPGDPPAFNSPSQTHSSQPATPPLTGCDAVSAPFGPRVSVASSDTDAGKSPKLTLTLERDAGDAYLTDLRMRLPEGMVGSPFATAATCTDEQAAVDQCPPESKVGSAKTTVAVFQNRMIDLQATTYLASPKGSELARLLTVLRTPPIANEQIVVLPATFEALPGLKGFQAHLSGMPPEFDIRKIEFTFDGSTGADRGQPLLINPTSCGPGEVSVEFGSELGQTRTATAPYQATNCDSLTFDPSFKVELDNTAPRAAAALNATIGQVPGQATASGITMHIPQGFMINTASKVTSCTNDQVTAGACPDSSRIGSALVESPLTNEPLTGKIFLADPAPGDTTSIRRIHTEVTGLLNMSIDANLVNSAQGGFDTVISNLPQVPISKFQISLNADSLLLNPYECGAKEFTATFASHSGKQAERTSDAGISGDKCGPTMNAELSPTKAGARSTLDLTVRPNKGGAPLKSVVFDLGSGRNRLQLRMAGRSHRGDSVGRLSLDPQAGKASSKKLVSRGRGKAKTSGKGLASQARAKLRRGKITLSRLPDKALDELGLRIDGRKNGVLRNPRRPGVVTITGRFVDTNGQQYVAKARVRVRRSKHAR